MTQCTSKPKHETLNLLHLLQPCPQALSPSQTHTHARAHTHTHTHKVPKNTSTKHKTSCICFRHVLKLSLSPPPPPQTHIHTLSYTLCLYLSLSLSEKRNECQLPQHGTHHNLHMTLIWSWKNHHTAVWHLTQPCGAQHQSFSLYHPHHA